MTPMQLKILRCNLNLTQAQMAERIGVSRSTYMRYEAGKTTINRAAEKLAHQEEIGLIA